MAVPGAGWFALCRDPRGNQFGLWQSDPAAQPPNLDPALAQFIRGQTRNDVLGRARRQAVLAAPQPARLEPDLA